jgi:hypothetical protein
MRAVSTACRFTLVGFTLGALLLSLHYKIRERYCYCEADSDGTSKFSD